MRREHAESDAPDGLVMTTLDIEAHAQALADMWNASDANWPGTWTGGVPETAANVRRTHERQEALETFLCMDGDVVAGFCKVMPDLDEPGVDYVALVNVPPSHQKRGLARRLLQRANALAVDRGSSRLDLHTWSANLSAVPLYKKVGFMWMPDTDIHMLNFMPAVLRLDAARDFFATRDWYRVLRRTLDQTPDEERWENMKVFTYRFVDSPDDPPDAEPSLVVRVDREARAICAVETPQYAAAATAARVDPPRGGEVALRWTLTNRSDSPLPVTVVATGTDELLVDYRGATEVAPGTTEVLEAGCRIAPDAEEVKPGKPVPSVKTVLLMGGQVVELSTGLRPRPALEIETSPAKITLFPGERRRIQVRLRSRLDEPVEVDLRAAGSDGLETSWTRRQLQADAEGWCGTELEVAVPENRSFAYPLSLSAGCQGSGPALRVEAEPRHVFALGPGALVTAREKESLRVENDHFRAVIDKRGATLRLSDHRTSQGLAAYGAVPGPPFAPSEFRTLDYDLELERTDQGVQAVATTRSKRWPGFVFRSIAAFSASPVVELHAEAENGGADSRKVQIMQISNHGQQGRKVLPFTSGLIAGALWADFPGSDDDASKKPDKWAENWSATELRDGSVIGTVWAEDLEEVLTAGRTAVTRATELEPQQAVRAEPFWMYVGPGRWQTVRELWRRRAGVIPPRDAAPEVPQEPVRVRVESGPWMGGPGSGPATLVLEHGCTWPVEGTATLTAPPGWTLDRTTIELAGTTWREPARAEVNATAPDGASSAGLVRVAVRAREFDRDLEIPVLGFAPGEQPTVTPGEAGRGVWRIQAGRSELAVAPDHAGAAISWMVDGVEQLASPYPGTGSMGWMLPWHGGITPILMMGEVAFPGRMWSERFEIEEAEEKDSTGLLWRGAKVFARSTHEDSRGMGLESVTLASSGAPVLKSIVRIHNDTGAVQTPMFGSMVFCAPGGEQTDTCQFSGEGVVTKPSDRYVFNTSATWAASVNRETGATLMICSDREIEVAKFGADGGHFLNLRGPEVPAGDTAESVSYLVAADSLEAARPWRALTQLR